MKSAALLLLVCSIFATAQISSASKMVGLIHKKSYDAFVDELSKKDIDPNQPDEKGKLPIIEAIKGRAVKFVDVLIQYHASVNVKELATGSSAVSYAFQSGMANLVRPLLAYGADIDEKDKSGKSARDVKTTPEVTDLVKLWDLRGAQGFEDAPGTWLKSATESGDKYWFNKETMEARWNRPPSVAWTRIVSKTDAPWYYNEVTGQSLGHMPDPLAWRMVNRDGEPLWYNYRTKATSRDVPADMPADMVEEAERAQKVFWYNEVTKEAVWDDPKLRNLWKVIDPETPDEHPFYYNIKTGEKTWKAPAELSWVKMDSEEHGQAFYHNVNSKESVWEKPHTEAWVAQEAGDA